MTGVTVYEFLRGLRATSGQKFWLEISYKDYAHGKIVLTSEDFEVGGDKSIATFLKKRLEQNRRRLLNNPQELKQLVQCGDDNDIMIVRGDRAKWQSKSIWKR